MTEPSNSSDFSADDDGNQAAAAEAIQSCWREKRKRDIARDAAITTAKALTTKREAGELPLAVTELIETIEQNDGDAPSAACNITDMVVVRTPVQDYVGHLMQIISIGKYKDAIAESPYDRMFHLSVLINGKYVLQKNEVIDLSDGGAASVTEESEVMKVNIPGMDTPSPLTFTMLLDNTKRHMGDIKFSDYCAVTNNCQDFILAVLQSNGLATKELESFIKQDAEAIFNQLPIHTKPVAKALTNTAAVANKLAEDITIKHRETDYSALLEETVPADRLDDASRLMKNLKVTKSEAEAILKSDKKKREKMYEGLGLLRNKLKGDQKE
mmetsp:Transcript_22325/g.48560  ORF Transcript_22325/g.48560 Transcript_22325/m.48560 type:complete len:327 (+) Transcript_22325:60-1040(+)|eukprot:CAMPEP_0178640080 /NCGR_PEP_ID=MMETSP0698-20121128/15819_1 /TAXON_ID=265572 /ORGANISM="Extubocellulus spinifer, Strain CCMP396" /LENGTH=326 /DNA_ID=CAMNT_0020280483 /DNA_START=276 /DNA_END=1256 /DNA_ORIENTATION=+